VEMDFSLLATQLLNGVQLGVLLFLLASGLTLIFGIMDFVNLAHGSFYMIGAFVCATLTFATGSFFLAIFLAIPITAVVGLVVESTIISRLYQRDHLDHVLATFGFILIFDTLTHMIWGPNGIAIPLPAYLDGRIAFTENLQLPTFRLLIVGTGLLVAFGLYFLVTHTKLGMLIRAGASNRTMATALGVNIKLLFTFVFALGGSMKGAFVASMIVGLIDTMGRSYLDSLMKVFMSENMAETAAPAVSAMLVYILMAAILAFRPQGLFPAASR